MSNRHRRLNGYVCSKHYKIMMPSSCEFKEIDPFVCPLDKTNIIEASAGTGKTYTILILVSRFLLEKKYSIQEMSVMTFTDAATTDLKKKIYQMLMDLKKIFSQSINNEQNDSLLKHWQIQILITPHKQKEWLAIIDDALKHFNEATICTIHSFAAYLLAEFSFESKQYLNQKLIKDESSYYIKAVEDFWRMHFYRDDDFHAKMIANSPQQNWFTIDKLSNIARNICPKLINADTIFNCEDTQTDSDKRKKKIPELIKAVPIEALDDRWIKNREILKDILIENKVSFDKNTLKAIYKNIDMHFEYTSAWIMDFKKNDYPLSTLPKTLEIFGERSSLESLLNKNCYITGDYNISAINELVLLFKEVKEKVHEILMVIEKELIYFLQRFVLEIRERLEHFKQTKDYHNYDDLLIKLKQALEDEDKSFQKIIQRKYKLGIIDEFQDTSYIQYEIFKRIFQTETSSVFLRW